MNTTEHGMPIKQMNYGSMPKPMKMTPPPAPKQRKPRYTEQGSSVSVEGKARNFSRNSQYGK